MNDNQAFQDAVRSTLDREVSPQRARAIRESRDGFDTPLWELMCDLGWAGIQIPEPYGGLGGTFAETCVVLRELSRKAIPSPYFSSAVLTSAALLGSGNEQLRHTILPGLAMGSVRGALAFGGNSGQLAEVGYRHARRGAAQTLSGHAGLVLDAHLADFVVVRARSENDDVVLFLVDTQRAGVDITMAAPVDLTRRFAQVSLHEVPVTDDDLLAGPRDAGRLFDHVVKAAAIGVAAESVGGAEQILDDTVAYVKIREQFGRPIGSFQAVKHGCAEMLLLVETSRVAAEHAAQTVQLGRALSSDAAFIAKSYAAEACYKVAGSGMQYHGGIGFTWDNDMHAHFKRAALARSLFGLSGWHLDRLATSVIAEYRGPRA